MNRVERSIIDVWDSGTFDAELIDFLARNLALMRAYLERDREIFLAHDLGRATPRSLMRPDNAHARCYGGMVEAAGQLMGQRIIRAYHYTRLCDLEVAALRESGIVLSTPDSLRTRVNEQISRGRLTPEMGELIQRDSPFESAQREVREDRFWMTSHPTLIDDGGVEPLLAHWGGEVAHMRVRDQAVRTALAHIGLPAIVEVAVPLAQATDFGGAGRAVVATFARAHGSTPEKFEFDLYVESPLPASAIMAVHCQGDPEFAAMGQGYPAGFVDVAIGRWQE